MPYELAIENVTLVSPHGRQRAHLYVQDGRIAAMAATTAEQQGAARRVDGTGLLALPGAVDGHVHFMDPTEPDREDFISGTSAAAVGGVTTVIEHTHSAPVRDAGELRAKVARLRGRALIDFGLAAHVWPDRLASLEDAWRAGATFVKIFTCTTHGVPGLDNAHVYRTFERLARFDGLALVHCEDESLTVEAEHELRQAGAGGGHIIPLWRNREAESVAVGAVALLAARTGARVTIAHASNPEVVNMAAGYRAQGARLWTESCPQYFYLREDEVLKEGAFRKFTPPARARSQADTDAMWEALRRGLITHVSSDHAPSTKRHKNRGIWEAPFGLPGVETTLPMLLKGVAEGRLDLERLVDVVAETPSRLYGLYPRKGALAVGSDADIVLVDPEAHRRLADDDVVSRAGWTPYAQTELHGLPVMTFSRGRLVAQNGKAVGEPSWGEFLPGPGGRTDAR